MSRETSKETLSKVDQLKEICRKRGDIWQNKLAEEGDVTPQIIDYYRKKNYIHFKVVATEGRNKMLKLIE